MEFVFLILFVLLLFAIYSVADRISRLGNVIDGMRYDLKGISEELEKIFKIMDGESKMMTLKKKEIEALKKKLIKQLLAENKSKTQDEAEEEAAKTFKKIEEEVEKHGDSTYLLSVKKWVEKSEDWVENRNKYEHLLDKAREYISRKSQFKEGDLEKALETDYSGVKWLLEMLEAEKKVERVTKWDNELEGSRTVGWKAVK